MKEKLYNVFVKNNKTGKTVKMNGANPLPHSKACVFLSKITKYPWRTEYLEEEK